MELRNDKKHDSVSQPRACIWAARQSQDATVSMWADRFSGEQLALGLPRWHSGKNPPANAGDARDVGSTPGSGRSPGREHGNPLQYSCLENPMNRGAWRATVHGVTHSQTRLKWLSTHISHTVRCTGLRCIVHSVLNDADIYVSHTLITIKFFLPQIFLPRLCPFPIKLLIPVRDGTTVAITFIIV